MKSIAVFCGSKSGNGNIYMETAKKLGEKLASEKITLVYGGAQVGCMGSVADAALKYGGKVIGVIPEKLRDVEIAHNQLTELHVVDTMHERKAMMADLADAFLALPGGAGTLEEWFEVFTWAQLGYHNKPCALLNVDGFFDPLISMLDHTIEKGFMSESYREMILIASNQEELFEKLENYRPIYATKWT
ncbi:TIGR00730 family Rossman fold protein [Bacillus sp. JJ722]|uniref:LOG family protein n=1 Tax=Bacillus sp. JJ722 TaxID=3122973 RepID=UPI002FFFB211